MDATPPPTPASGPGPPAPAEAPGGSFTVQHSVRAGAPASLPALPAPPPPAEPPLLQTAWPKPARWALAALLGLAAVLLAAHWLRSVRWRSRPTDLERGLGYRIDLNRAARAELLQLPGVGEALARQIEDYRQAHGGFRRVDDLLRVPGVGPARLAAWKPWLWVDGGDPDREDDQPDRAGERRRDVRKFPAAAGKNGDQPARPGKKEASLKEKINVNKASAEELMRLPRIREKMSQRIIAERRRRLFQSVEDLRRVPGIGPKTLEKLRPFVTVGNEKEPQMNADQRR